MEENYIILEIEKLIKKFDIQKIHKANEIKIINKSQNELSIFIEFDYVNYYENKKHYIIGIDFDNVRINYETGLDIINLLNINSLNIRNIENRQMEGIDWEIINEDDDGKIIFKMYCKKINIKYIE